MIEREFDLLLEESIRAFGDQYIDIPDEAWTYSYEFSPKFEKKMQKLIRREQRFYFPLVKTPVRRLVTIAVTVVIALSVLTMSVGALRSAFFQFLTEVFSTHTVVKSSETDGSPTDFRDVYEPTELPDQFELIQKNDSFVDIPYLFLVYKKDDRYIVFQQWLKSEYDTDINTEQNYADPIEINGFEGFILNMDEDRLITWDNGDYILEITSNIGKDALIPVAESVQKVES